MNADQWTLARRRMAKRRRIELRGQRVRMSTERVFAHVDALIAEGWTEGRIAATADVNIQLLNIRYSSMDKLIARRILAVDRAALYRSAEGGDRVPAVGSRRRVQALQAMGWSLAATGIPNSVLSRVLRSRDTVAADTYRKICEAYDRLAMTRGDGRQARNRARRQGWALPLCWDDDTIDDPAAEPYQPRSARDDRHGPHAERLDQVAELTAAGVGATVIAERLDVSVRTVERLRAELAETQIWKETG